MGIVFFCQNCGARFDIDARLAGKKARCKPCGQGLSIPRPDELVSTASTSAVDTVSIRPDTAGPARGGASAGARPRFRTLEERAYLVSIPFLVIFLFSTAVKNQPMAVFGAAFVVLLNLGRLVAVVAGLAGLRWRDGLNVNELQKPAQRVAEPALLILLVILAFTFIPWL
jgi:hypothetical protein